jgi:hypothetical protein
MLVLSVHGQGVPSAWNEFVQNEQRKKENNVI